MGTETTDNQPTDSGRKAAPILIVGAGRMGCGIALTFAFAGYRVHLADMKDRPEADFQQLQQKVAGIIRADLEFLVTAGLLPAEDMQGIAAAVQVFPNADLASAADGARYVFEGVPETIDAKKQCFGRLSGVLEDAAIVTSTTSTIDANDLAPLISHPERFLNAHWLNPAHLMPLIEVSPSEQTSETAIADLMDLFRSIGKVPIRCKASPGYIVPRIQSLAMNEAARMVEEGVASAEDIDTAVRIGFGLRFSVLGLLEFIDWGGCDILYHASNYLSGTLDPTRFAAPRSIHENMDAKRRGIQDGEGFYDYRTMDVAAYRNQRLTEFVTALTNRGLQPRRPGTADNDN